MPNLFTDSKRKGPPAKRAPKPQSPPVPGIDLKYLRFLAFIKELWGCGPEATQFDLKTLYKRAEQRGLDIPPVTLEACVRTGVVLDHIERDKGHRNHRLIALPANYRE